MPHDIFISHSREDKLTADAACAILEQNGIRCWIAPRDVAVGVDYSDQLTQAIEDCRAVVIVFSSHSNTSHHVKAEIDSAFAHNKILFPFRIEDIEPTKGMAHYLRTVHWMDAFSPPLEKHLQKMADAILRLLPDRRVPTASVAVPAPLAPPSLAIAPAAAEKPAHPDEPIRSPTLVPPPPPDLPLRPPPPVTRHELPPKMDANSEIPPTPADRSPIPKPKKLWPILVAVTLVVGVIWYGIQSVNKEPKARRAILSNLRMLSIGSEQYFLDRGVSSVASMDLVGTNSSQYLNPFLPVAKETYTDVIIQGNPIMASDPTNGRTVTFSF
jgi:hypothetical protein